MARPEVGSFRIREWYGKRSDAPYAEKGTWYAAQVYQGWWRGWAAIGPPRNRREYAEEDIEVYIRVRDQKNKVKVTTYYNREGQRHG